MINPFESAGLFLIETLADFYIFIVLLRVVMQWTHADFKNPIFEASHRLTQPLIQHFKPRFFSFKGIDFGSIILLLGLELVKITLLLLIQAHEFPNWPGLLILSFGELLNLLIDLFFYAILALAILSWFSPLAHSPLIAALYRITEPLTRPARKLIRPIGGLDISPVLVMIALRLISILLVNPLINVGLNWVG